MSHTHSDLISRPILIAASSLVVISLVLTAAVRYERLRTGEALPAGATAAPIGNARVEAARTVVLHEQDDGTIVISALDGSMAPRTLAPSEGGFIRGSLRALRHRRAAVGAEGDPVVQITRLSDGRLLAEETASGMVVDLAAFGSTNRAAFAALLGPDTGEVAPGGAATADAATTTAQLEPSQAPR